MPALSILGLKQFRPPVRRVLAVDPGSRRIKLLLAQSQFGKLRLLKQEVLDLHAEGLVSADEVRGHLLPLLQAWGHPPIALTLPEHASISQRIDLALVPDDEVEKLIADQTVKLSGVSDSKIIYDFVPVHGELAGKQQFWVSLCQEGEIRERTLRFGIDQEDICEVTTTANALANAFRATAPASRDAILVHVGAQTTVVVGIASGQNAFAGSFQMGGDFFTRSLMRIFHGSEESAESLKRSRDLLNGADASPEFRQVVDGWLAELSRQLQDWTRENPALGANLARFEFVGSGGGLEQPGLREYLATKGLSVKPWPSHQDASGVLTNAGFEAALGSAVQALDHAGQQISLLPSDYRLRWDKRVTRQRIEIGSVALSVVCALVLLFGSWQKLSVIEQKQALLTKVISAQATVDANNALSSDLIFEYESLRPVALRQQNTIDVLKTLSLLEQPGTNRPYWLVLVADQASYFSHAPAVLSTNRVARTNAPAGPALAPPGPAMDVTRAAYASTNVAAAKPGLIAELCIPGDAEATRRMLSDVVSGLKQQPFLSKVDLVSEDLRRGLADPKVTIPDRFYAIALDFAETDLQQPWRTRRSPYPRHETPQKGPASGGNGSGGKGFSRTGSAQN